MSERIIYYRFRMGSSLWRYLEFQKKEQLNKFFTLTYLLDKIILIIEKENMFDLGNENIILCSKYLSHALDVNALHVFQLKEYVLKHLIIVNSAIINEAKALFVQNTNYPDKNCKCVLTFSLRSIFSVIPTFPQQQYEFTFKEVCDLLILYIMFNRRRFVDIRNNEVFIIKDDPLSVLFKVKAFHKSQAKDLLLNHISIIK